MELLAILLVGASAFTHATWNLIAKARTPSAAFFLLLTLIGEILLAIPTLIFYPSETLIMLRRMWWLIALTGAAQSLYYICLAGAYQRSEVSVAYPLARSVPVVITPIAVYICGFGPTPTAAALFGMVLIFLGCMSLPQKSFRYLFDRRNYRNRGLPLALAAAVFIAAYSVIDKEGCRQVEESGLIPNIYAVAMFYSLLENIGILAFLTPYVLIRRGERKIFFDEIRGGHLWSPFWAAVCCSGGYLLVLCGMQLVTNVSYIVAFRQLSIPLGALMGILILKERFTWPKVVGVILIFAGLVLVSVKF